MAGGGAGLGRGAVVAGGSGDGGGGGWWCGGGWETEELALGGSEGDVGEVVGLAEEGEESEEDVD